MLLKAALMDLNNVGEDYLALSDDVDALIGATLQSIDGIEAEAVERGMRSAKHLKARFRHLPLHYYPAFWNAVAADSRASQLPPDVLGSQLFRRFIAYYRKQIRIYPDFIPLLKYLRKVRHLRLALLANGHPSRVKSFVSKYRLNRFVDDVLISGATPWRKPDPDFFRFALERLRVGPCQAIHIGDRVDTDVLGGNQVGIWTVRVRRGSESERDGTLDLERPDCEVGSLDAVHDLSLFSKAAVGSAVIVCGGRGVRLGELGDRVQKCLVPVSGVPILDRVIDRLVSSGVGVIHLLLGYRADEVQKHVRETWRRHNVQFHCHRPEASSTAEALTRCMGGLPEIFFYCHADIVVPERFFKELLRKHYESGGSVIASTIEPVAPTHPVLRVDVDSVAAVARHAPGTEGVPDWQWSVGVAILHKRDLTNCSQLDGASTVEQLLALSSGSIFSVQLREKWFHLETPADLNRYEELQLEEVRNVEV